MADEKVLTPEEQKVADVKAAQKAEAAAAKEAKEREKFIAKLIKEGGKPALSKRPPRALPSSFLAMAALPAALQRPFLPALKVLL